MNAVLGKRVAAVERLEYIAELAERLAPAFRDKLDFSKPEDYDSLVEYAYKAAEAFHKKMVSDLEALTKKYDELLEAEVKAKEAAK